MPNPVPSCVAYGSRFQNGQVIGFGRVLTHWLVVKASMFAGPPKRPPLLDAPMPPKGTWNSLFTGWSLMWTMPVFRRQVHPTRADAGRIL